MARARLLKPGFFTNESLVELPYAARLLFQGLWLVADREGRLEDRPKRLKMELFPADDLDVEEHLQMLADVGLLLRYEAEGGRYIAIPSFTRHQSPHVREPASTIPAPCKTSARQVPDTEETGAGPAVSGDPVSGDPVSGDPVDDELVVAADAAKPSKRITKAFLEKMSEEFPDVDVGEEYEKATNHIAYGKWRDKQQGFRNWLKKSDEWRKNDGRNNNHATRRAVPTGTFAEFG